MQEIGYIADAHLIVMFAGDHGLFVGKLGNLLKEFPSKTRLTRKKLDSGKLNLQLHYTL